MLTFLFALMVLVSSAFAKAPETLIFDTDTAFFSDDGVALAMLINHPEVAKIDGITIVAGNEHPIQGVEYMAHVLDLMKKNVPLYMGAAAPLVNSAASAAEMRKEFAGEFVAKFSGALGQEAPSKDKLKAPSGGKFSSRRPESKDAISYLIERLENSKFPVTIVALGPMTNLATAIARKPAIVAKIKRLIFMGGNVHVPGNITKSAEFNFWFDPEAAHAVLSAPIREKIMVGLDLTNQALITKKHFDELVAVSTPLTRLLNEDLGDGWPGFNKKPNATRHIWDALVAAYIIEPSIVTKSEVKYLDVITAKGANYGGVNVREGRKGETPVTVLTGLDFDKFFALFRRSLQSSR